MQYKLEICANSIESALAAQEGRADRIELCDNMAEGGTTPSYGLIRQCKKLVHIPVFPIIRPRGGNFVYTPEEFEVMKDDVLMCKTLNCEGVVMGILTPDGSVDKERCRVLVDLARPMQVVFHRAFDCCHDLSAALEDIISLGFNRLLTSGGASKAADAHPVLRLLAEQAGDRICIMPGSGINEKNIASLAIETGTGEFHSTARAALPDPYRTPAGIFDQIIPATSVIQVHKLRKVLCELAKE